MSVYTAPVRDMRFVLNNVIGLRSVADLPGLEGTESDLVDQILEEAAKLSGDVLAPLNPTGDKQGALRKWCGPNA